MKLYYKLAVSTIYTMKNSPKFSDMWKSMSLVMLTINLGFNLITLFLLVKGLSQINIGDYVQIDFINNHYWNGFINLCFYAFIPIFLFNYYLVFNKNRFEQLIVKYHSAFKKKIFGIHFFLSLTLLYLIFIFFI